MTKFTRKVIAIVVTALMVLSIVGTAAFANDNSAIYQESANILKGYGVMIGDGNGNLMLDQPLKRQDAVIISLRLMGIADKEFENYEYLSDFTDITDPYYLPIIGMAQDLGLVEGMGDGTFGFNLYIKAQDVQTLLLRALGYEITDEIYPQVPQMAEELGITKLVSVNKDELITRDKVAQMMLNTLNTKVKDGDKTLGEILGYFQVEQPTLSDVAAGEVSADGKVTITGKVEPATAKVTVAGNEIAVAQDGTFSAEVSLVEGENKIEVKAENNGKVDTKEVVVNYAAKLAIKSAQAVGIKKVNVEFNRALTAEEKANLNLKIKSGYVPYNVTVTYNENNTIATLESSFPFPAGDYTVEGNNLDPVNVKIEAERVAKVEIGAEMLQLAPNQDLLVKAYNQYNEEVAGAIADANINVYNATKGKNFTVTNGKIDGTEAAVGAAKDDTVIVTVTHPATGLTATKTYKLAEASTVASIKFGNVLPLEGKTRISINESGFEIPYTLADQYGKEMKFSSHAANADGIADKETINGVTFLTSNANIVNPDTFAVDANGKLTFNTGATAGTAIITAINTTNGTTATLTIVVNDVAKVKTFNMSNPGVLVVKGEAVKVPFTATNTFDEALTTKDFAATAVNSQVSFTSSNPNITVTKAFDSQTGELTLTFGGTGTGTTTVYAFVNGTIASQINVDVKAEASPVRITGIKNVQTLLAVGGSATLTADNLNIVDTYGRTVEELPAGYDFTVIAKDGTQDKASIANKTITGVAEGTEAIILKLQNGGVDVANSEYEFTVTVVKDEDIATYELKAIDKLYGKEDNTAASPYAKEITLIGKLADGREVAINQAAKITAMSTSDPSVIGVDLATLKIFAKKEGSATIAVWNGATKLAQITVEAVDEAPVPATVEFANKEITIAASGTYNLSADLTVKDQYGVALDNPETLGTWASSDTTKATVSNAGIVSHVATGEATISFVTTNGIAATVKAILQ